MNGSTVADPAEPTDTNDAGADGATSQIWGGRFTEAPDDLVRSYTASLQTDLLISRHDIAGSRAHARMLGQQEIIPADDVVKILDGLDQIEEEIVSGTFLLRPELEDIHMNIEARLAELIGEDAAGKLHTARSRNDQVALDSRMFVRDAIVQSVAVIRGLQLALVDQADRNIEVVMPGYTHLQRAQPILFAHALLAYFEMLDRDAERFVDAFERTDVMPLGSAALAGAAYPLNRESVAKELGFGQISKNSIDAVADRDYMLEYAAAAAICMTHISRLCEDLILWASAEFGFIEFSDRYSTGSSIMPQKKNPDIAELARGRTGRVLGNLIALLTVLKGLPLAYNRDLQEDKPALFDSVETLISTLSVLTGAIATATVHGDRAREAVTSDRFILATDYADYLTREGLPFREAHRVVGALVKQCETENKALADLTLAELKAQHRLFEKDAVGMTVEQALAARDVPGGTAPTRVSAAIAEARNRIRISVDGREGDGS
jgi:argininosuccinate lyase